MEGMLRQHRLYQHYFFKCMLSTYLYTLKHSQLTLFQDDLAMGGERREREENECSHHATRA